MHFHVTGRVSNSACQTLGNKSQEMGLKRNLYIVFILSGKCLLSLPAAIPSCAWAVLRSPCINYFFFICVCVSNKIFTICKKKNHKIVRISDLNKYK